MEEKVPPKKVWGWGRYFILRAAETPSPKTIKITHLFSYIYNFIIPAGPPSGVARDVNFIRNWGFPQRLPRLEILKLENFSSWGWR
jgi:hypothetical protein